MANTIDPGPPLPPGMAPISAPTAASDGTLPANVIHPKLIAGAAGGAAGLVAIAAAVATGVLQQCGGYQGVLEAALPLLFAGIAGYRQKGPAPA